MLRVYEVMDGALHYFFAVSLRSRLYYCSTLSLSGRRRRGRWRYRPLFMIQLWSPVRGVRTKPRAREGVIRIIVSSMQSTCMYDLHTYSLGGICVTRHRRGGIYAICMSHYCCTNGLHVYIARWDP